MIAEPVVYGLKSPKTCFARLAALTDELDSSLATHESGKERAFELARRTNFDHLDRSVRKGAFHGLKLRRREYALIDQSVKHLHSLIDHLGIA